jgi:hypothetical protein
MNAYLAAVLNDEDVVEVAVADAEQVGGDGGEGEGGRVALPHHPPRLGVARRHPQLLREQLRRRAPLQSEQHSLQHLYVARLLLPRLLYLLTDTGNPSINGVNPDVCAEKQARMDPPHNKPTTKRDFCKQK